MAFNTSLLPSQLKYGMCTKVGLVQDPSEDNACTRFTNFLIPFRNREEERGKHLAKRPVVG